MAKIIAAGEAEYEAVRLQEREKVVAWLRAQGWKAIAKGEYFADAIEAGDHLKDPA